MMQYGLYNGIQYDDRHGGPFDRGAFVRTSHAVDGNVNISATAAS